MVWEGGAERLLPIPIMRFLRRTQMFRLISMFLLLPTLAYGGATVFEDKNCDFAVTFPVQFQAKQVYKGSDVGLLATARPTESVKLSLECWPKENESIRDFVNKIQSRVQQQGIEVLGVTSERNQFGDVVTLSGRTIVQGKNVHLRLVSYFGPRTRLDLRVLDYNASGSKEQIDFRNSVRLRN